MSRSNVTDTIVGGLAFARACVLDQRMSSHSREDHSWDKSYAAALDAIDGIVGAHKKAAKKVARQRHGFLRAPVYRAPVKTPSKKRRTSR